ncbi:MAG: hypothetical protein WCX64_04830 [Candidatus Micrarchaeia archaeon]|jgi:hypothetical protein
MDAPVNPKFDPVITLKKIGLIFVFGGLSALLTHYDPAGILVGLGFYVGIKNVLTNALGVEF